MKLKKHVDYNKLLKDIHKGQSLQMLCYLYKLNRIHILEFAKNNNTTVFDPINTSDKMFMNCSVKLQGNETLKLTNGWR